MTTQTYTVPACSVVHARTMDLTGLASFKPVSIANLPHGAHLSTLYGTLEVVSMIPMWAECNRFTHLKPGGPDEGFSHCWQGSQVLYSARDEIAFDSLIGDWVSGESLPVFPIGWRANSRQPLIVPEGTAYERIEDVEQLELLCYRIVVAAVDPGGPLGLHVDDLYILPDGYLG